MADNTPVPGVEFVVFDGGPGGNNTQVPLPYVQHIYHELTQTHEEAAKRFKIGFQLDVDLIASLHRRVEQMLCQYNIISQSCKVSVFYADDTKEVFARFDAFTAYSAAATSITESVLLTYNFLIVPPQGGKPENYRVNLRLISRIATERVVSEQGFPPFLFAGAQQVTAFANVRFVDYTVAKAILYTIDDWLKACPHAETPAWIKTLRPYSSQIGLAIRYTIGALAIGSVWALVPSFLGDDAKIARLAAYLILGFGCIYGMYRVAFHLGRVIEAFLDHYAPLSYVKLTQGDATEIERAKSSRRFNILRGSSALIGAFIQALTVKFIVSSILERFF